VRDSAFNARVGAEQPQNGYTGVWLSRYPYYSNSRGEELASTHYVLIPQHSDRLTVRSIPGRERSTLLMDLVVAGMVVTGTWHEETEADGFYRGAVYHGAIQLLAEPTGRRMTGKWVGFGKEMDINTGPWELAFQEASTSKSTLASYDRDPWGRVIPAGGGTSTRRRLVGLPSEAGQNCSVGRTASETARLVLMVAWVCTAAWLMGGWLVGGYTCCLCSA
jgi:hypothetical protein